MGYFFLHIHLQKKNLMDFKRSRSQEKLENDHRQKKRPKNATSMKRSDHVIFQENRMVEKILSYVFDVRSYATFCKVSRQWNIIVYRNNLLWWPIFKRLWTSYDNDESKNREPSQFELSRFMMNSVVDTKPYLFANNKKKGESWQEQYQVCLLFFFIIIISIK